MAGEWEVSVFDENTVFASWIISHVARLMKLNYLWL